MNILVTGGAGFIGSHAVDLLLADGANVTVLDDLSTGSLDFLSDLDAIRFVEGDVRDPAILDEVLPGHDAVWHLAANPEVRTGATDPAGHVDANVGTTVPILEAMRRHDVKKLVFTSTSTVYGEADVRPTPESYGPLLPISVYGGCKLACEALASAYGATFGWDVLLMRFANVVGPRSNHGVTYDFVHKLRANPEELQILGDGTQTKSYVHVSDTVSGLLHAAKHAPPGVHAYNIGSDDAIDVMTIARTVADVMGLAPRFATTGGTKSGAGWTGDVKFMALANDALKNLGWAPTFLSQDAIRDTAAWLAKA